VKHRVFSYSPELTDSTKVAESLGIPTEQVYKTLVAYETPKKRFLVMIPSKAQLDLKKLAKAVGAKKVRLATHREAESWTRLKVGGISALALLNRGFKIFLDESAKTVEQVVVSAGERGTNVQLPVVDLLKLTNGRFIDVAVPNSAPDSE
ncbi:MAG: YbaK/EbsC family protein, partial [Chloroflexota bacterium]